MIEAAGLVIGQGETAAQGIFGAMLLRRDAGGYVLVAVVSFAAAVAITALCFRLRIRENRKKGGYVKERKQFGRSIAQFQNTQFELAEMKARVDAAKYLVYAAAQKKQAAMDGQKVRYSVEAAEAKLIAARTASDVTRRCLQLFGGYGYTRDYPIERMMRDAKITEIYEGTSEVQMMVISGALLK